METLVNHVDSMSRSVLLQFIPRWRGPAVSSKGPELLTLQKQTGPIIGIILKSVPSSIGGLMLKKPNNSL